MQHSELQQQLVQPRRLQRYTAKPPRPKAEARFLQRKNQLDRMVYSQLRLTDPELGQGPFQRIQEVAFSYPPRTEP